MTKTELINAVAERLGNKKDATAAVAAVLETIQDEVAKGEDVTLTGFGTFRRVQRAARDIRNPSTGETVRTEPKNVPAFKPGATFKAAVAAAVPA